ncbi:heat shock protein HSP70 [Blastocystis sp. subtype 4]|uniref:heat shock protein HSP70 n=1 Tax=Blastocystis sp. subtype 4 TaxID=944170 RepID=UPI00071223E4|nr:heat shock protein HSP70 [Blastocystis sp. subtype 4]KNB41612.1 heat shock protein HSP70 [Blastocystis sp. subtype 4]|eukprot:XP_014525055.1 heat shock protein HSP70 [Blastocystis sp. subtype 4]
METSPSTAIGIDLGTTNSCVAVWKNGQIQIAPSDMGTRTIPSVVSFTDTERIIGVAAKKRMKSNFENTVYDVKRLIGHAYKDPEVQNDMKMWSFKVSESVEGKPVINLKYKKEPYVVSPEQISAMILEQMKKQAEAFLDAKVTKAVITVPAYFNDSQRQATKDAATIAGLQVLRILNEPSAAAFAYGFENQNTEKNILIYDLGGGTFDVSILHVKDGQFEVISCNGDSHLGGNDFDSNLSRYVMEQYKRETGEDISENRRWRARVRDACESCKMELSFTSTSRVEFEDSGFECAISRFLFEDLNASLFKKTITIVEKTLRDANLDKNSIHEVVLVGGSTRIPKIQEMLTNCFPHSKVCKSINPDEAVAMGALIMAQKEDGDKSDEKGPFEDISILDCTPLSLGVETVGGMMSVMIPRNTRIPTSYTDVYTTPTDNQTTVEIKVFQGERLLTRDNCLLGKFMITDIPMMKADEPIIEITFYIDENNILSVSAIEKGSQKQSKILIDNANTNLSQAQIQMMVETAKKFRRDDEENAKKLMYINDLENLVRQIHDLFEQKRLPEEVTLQVSDEVNSLQDFLYSCSGAEMNDILASIQSAQMVIDTLQSY